jgi:hypothetical protein
MTAFWQRGLDDTPEEFFPDPGRDETGMTFVIPGEGGREPLRTTGDEEDFSLSSLHPPQFDFGLS